MMPLNPQTDLKKKCSTAGLKVIGGHAESNGRLPNRHCSLASDPGLQFRFLRQRSGRERRQSFGDFARNADNPATDERRSSSGVIIMKVQGRQMRVTRWVIRFWHQPIHLS
jgi:hypothetical protein